MDERHLEPEETAPRPLVHELGAAGREPRKLVGDVGDLEGDVMHPGPPFREELADRRLGAEGREQLDPAVTHPERRRLDALVGKGLAMFELGTEELSITLDRGIEIVNRNADMVDAPNDDGDATDGSA